MYRVKALEPEVKGSHDTEDACRQLSRMCHAFGLDTSRWDEAADEILAKREPNKWLLEEARYKVELGKVVS